MKKTPLYLLFFGVIGCRSHSSTRPLIMERLRYSQFVWRYDANTANFRLYLANYLELERTGKYIAMKHDTFMKPAQFFSGVIEDTLRNQIDKFISGDSSSKNYLIPANSTVIYDGPYCALDCQKADSARRFIIFVPRTSPKEIQQLGFQLENVISSGKGKRVDSFSTEGYQTEIQKMAIAAGIRMPKLILPTVVIKK